MFVVVVVVDMDIYSYLYVAQDNETRKRQEAAPSDPLSFGVGLLLVGSGSFSSSTVVDTHFMHQWTCYQFGVKDGQSLAGCNQCDQEQSSNLEEAVHFIRKNRERRRRDCFFLQTKFQMGASIYVMANV